MKLVSRKDWEWLQRVKTFDWTADDSRQIAILYALVEIIQAAKIERYFVEPARPVRDIHDNLSLFGEQ